MGAQVATQFNVSEAVSAYLFAEYKGEQAPAVEIAQVKDVFKLSQDHLEKDLADTKKSLKNVTQKYEDALEIFKEIFASKHKKLAVMEEEVKNSKEAKEYAEKRICSLSEDRRTLEKERDELLNMLFEKEARLVSSGIFNQNKRLTEMKVKLESSGKTYPVARPRYLK